MIGVDFGSNHCCGVLEVGSFTTETEYSDASGDTPAELIVNLFERVRARYVRADGFVYHIWFVRHRNYNGAYTAPYEFDELREYISGLPGCIALGEHINPNTNNMIDGYLFKETTND